MTKPVLIEYPDGQRYGVSSAAAAAKVHPNAKIVSYEDGEPFEEPKPRPKRKRTSRAKQAVTTPPVTAEAEDPDGPDV